MNTRIKELRDYIFNNKHHQYRRSLEELDLNGVNKLFSEKGLSDVERSQQCLAMLLEKEVPVILKGERIVATRTISDVPPIYTEEEWRGITEKHFIHERGTVSNICPNYEDTIKSGFAKRKDEIQERLKDSSLLEGEKTFLDTVYKSIESVQKFIDVYADHAASLGEEETSEVLRNIKDKGASSFREALQLMRILHFTLWESGNYHNTFGRFDQYMYPYFKNDIATGKLTEDEAFDLLEEFFLSCNKDSDLYPGIQQGDNGQSMVLGGVNAAGEDQFNELSEMCLKASYELNLIDPKINIRVNSNTPLEIFEKGSELTKIGLGFPQYSNDDIVIPGLVRKGYSHEDACDYAVAACWEFIIPKLGMDIPNIDALSLAECVLNSVPRLDLCNTYEEFYGIVEGEIQNKIDAMCEKHKNIYIEPSPFLSLLMSDTIKNAKDISQGAKYNNYGIHGTGIATAADSMAALKKYYFESRELGYEELMEALKNDYKGYEEIQKKLRLEAPKMGQDEDYVDSISGDLLNSFDKALENKKNERDGIYRAGTGTALFYINHSTGLTATPDGRAAGEVIPANYSPSLFMKQKGPVSVIKSFTKPDLKNTINGGPLTLEFDESVFNNQESVSKLAMLVHFYIIRGGHQIQLNTINREKLIDAKIHPELYRNLIVRVWGWSGYFVELDEVYQDHVIARYEYSLA
ncbi:pyruvate formate lyase family protein [Sunxiuqinia sp. A32]|uniref:pyruvate formate lyase family protein n=1 Tax=Sunxiuqinia sp. A32 TaxID=3461496 RepID=UPI004045DDFD